MLRSLRWRWERMPPLGLTKTRVELLLQKAPGRKGRLRMEMFHLPAIVEPVSCAGHLRQWGGQRMVAGRRHCSSGPRRSPDRTPRCLPAAAAPLLPLHDLARAAGSRSSISYARPGPEVCPSGRDPFGTKSGRHGRVWSEEGLRRRVGTEGECMSVSTFLRKTISCTLNFCLGPSPLNL